MRQDCLSLFPTFTALTASVEDSFSSINLFLKVLWAVKVRRSFFEEYLVLLHDSSSILYGGLVDTQIPLSMCILCPCQSTSCLEKLSYRVSLDSLDFYGANSINIIGKSVLKEVLCD